MAVSKTGMLAIGQADGRLTICREDGTQSSFVCLEDDEIVSLFWVNDDVEPGRYLIACGRANLRIEMWDSQKKEMANRFLFNECPEDSFNQVFGSNLYSICFRFTTTICFIFFMNIVK